MNFLYIYEEEVTQAYRRAAEGRLWGQVHNSAASDRATRQTF